MSKDTEQKIYCTAPFNGLTIREDGHVRTCCQGRISLGNLNEMSIKDIEQSPVLKQVQQDMLSNSYHLENCRTCVDQEKTTGLATLREHYLKFYPKFDPQQLQLKFIDVRWNNLCNLGCLYCSPTFSSIWDERLNQIKKNPRVKPYQDELLDWILEKIDHVEEIMLVGGEPMLMKQNYVLLSRLPRNCKISIITNLSYNLKNLPCWSDLLTRPKELIRWNVSLENTGKKFEYVRSGSDWHQFEENFVILKEHWPENVSLNMCYNLFSAFDLLHTIEYFHRLDMKKFNLFPVVGNNQINLSNFPRATRMQAAEKLQEVKQKHFEFVHPEDRDLYPFQGLDSILQSLLENDSPSTITLEEFDKKIDWYDQWGSDRFKNLWPDLYDNIKTQLTLANDHARVLL